MLYVLFGFALALGVVGVVLGVREVACAFRQELAAVPLRPGDRASEGEPREREPTGGRS